MSMATANAAKHRPMTAEERKVIIASSAGTVFEWYDFYLAGSLAANIAAAFVPGTNETARFIFVLFGFAAGFAVRPFGALFFGRLGDLIGRRRASAPGAIAGVIRELDRVHRPDLVAQSLQGECCCPIADIAVGNVALEREEPHGRRQLATRKPVIIVRRVFGGALRCRSPFVRAAASSICRAPTRGPWRRPGPCRPTR